MRKMTPDQARQYILAGYFPEKPPDLGDLNHIPALSYAYLKEITELHDIFSSFPQTFCATLYTDDKHSKNAYSLFSMIFDEDELDELHDLSIQIIENRESFDEYQERAFQLERELGEINSIIKRLEEEYARLTAEM